MAGRTPAGRPTVYVSLGTIFAKVGAFGAVLAGLADEPLNVIATVGADNDPADLGPQPDNVHVERYISQAHLLPYCDAVVNQGGTAILPILAHGLPILVLPQGANQFHNAEACVRAGVGRSLLPEAITPAAVRGEVRALLTEPGYRERAGQCRRDRRHARSGRRRPPPGATGRRTPAHPGVARKRPGANAPGRFELCCVV